jgi:hypothetical protein
MGLAITAHLDAGSLVATTFLPVTRSLGLPGRHVHASCMAVTVVSALLLGHS